MLEYCLHHIEGEEAELAFAGGDMWEKRKAALQAWEAFRTNAQARRVNCHEHGYLARPGQAARPLAASPPARFGPKIGA